MKSQPRKAGRQNACVWLVSLFLLLAAVAGANASEHAALRQSAAKAEAEGNYRDAYALYRRLCLEIENDPREVGPDLTAAIHCLTRLGRAEEIDAFREQVVERHSDNWRLLEHAALSLRDNEHRGYLIAGTFHRGSHRGGGALVNAFERDRIRALQLMDAALRLSAGDPGRTEAARLCLDFADTLHAAAEAGQAWRLQVLSDLSRLPDFEPGYGYEHFRRSEGAPVDADGHPVFHRLPERFEAAASDGERWRFLLARTAVLDPGSKSEAIYRLASFLHQQFGVQTMADYGRLLGWGAARPADGGPPDAGRAFEVHTLRDNETIARLANGVRRFDLPDEFNFIRLFSSILAEPESRPAAPAARTLAEIFENRRQLDRAVTAWEKNRRYDAALAENRMAQITGCWGEFEPLGVQPAGRPPVVDYRFRNGRRVFLEAHAIRVRKLLEDVKAVTRSRPARLDWREITVDDIGFRLVHENQTRYVGELAARWSLALEPDPRHWDRRTPIIAPQALRRPGAYLLTARLEGGNTARIILWVSDTAIVKKPLNGQVLYYVADAVTGKPLPGLSLDLFAYRQKPVEGTTRYEIETRSLARTTDEDGLVVLGPQETEERFSWLATAGGSAGRLAYLGFAGIWYARRSERDTDELKTFVMTDRPVYRPGQKVNFKTWVGQARYDEPDASPVAGRRFTLELRNPLNEVVFSRVITADAYGGLAGQFELPQDAPLGVYRVSHTSGGVFGGETFRVEEYRKPEFEVTINAPQEPVALGETITAVVSAAYYFGEPVKEAAVRYRVLRSAVEARWYPPSDWDWLYGPGYGWFGYDTPWYPGWERWGCKRPLGGFMPYRPPLPPEVVAEGEIPIDADGRAAIAIDTTLAKLIHADQDQRYTITAEVRDRSRRTVVGRGEVLAARRPFRVVAWADRGHYRVGDTVVAGFMAQTLDRRPVRGRGELRLLSVAYAAGEPRETELERWSLDTDDSGRASLRVEAARPGQYRLSYRLSDAGGRTEEGGTLFSVHGAGEGEGDFRFAKIELVPDRGDYTPGERVRLRVNTERAGAAVMLFVRPLNGVYPAPAVLRREGKSTEVEIAVSQKDMPNFFVEAVTVYDGRVFSEVREIAVPPHKRVLEVALEPSKQNFRPGETARLNLALSEPGGAPFQGTAVVTVYDRALEYISGGSNVPDIRAFFWKWRRSHHPRTESSLDRHFRNLLKKDEPAMQAIGVFGDPVDAEQAAEGARRLKSTAVAAPAPAGPPAAPAEDKGGETPGETEAPAAVPPAVRSVFADTAFWAAAVVTDGAGRAELGFTMPQNLTGWIVRTWAMGAGTRVGEGSARLVTCKDLLLRLQAPRFLVENDEAVLTANVHNALPRKKQAAAAIELEAGGPLSLAPGEDSHRQVSIAAGGEARLDWRTRALSEGEAVVRMKALSDEESDAVEMRFPVRLHGAAKQVPKTGVIRADGREAVIEFDVPAERRPELSRLELRYSPTLAGAMVDALPYLAGYPYGCTEQTLNRFLPTVVTLQTLKRMGIDLKAVREKRSNLNPRETGPDAARARQWQRYGEEPVFDEQLVADMARTGARRLADMQLEDGGWGWFSGSGERSSPHTTAYVVHGLQLARQAGVVLPPEMLARGVAWLANYRQQQTDLLEKGEPDKKGGKFAADNLDALVAMVLTDEGLDSPKMRGFLLRDRAGLSVYGQAMLGLALAQVNDRERLAAVMHTIEQVLVTDAENQSAFLRLPNESSWWRWYGDEIETHAYTLKLLARTRPESPAAAGLATYLLNNRKHATTWNSTRDTSTVVEALADFLQASGEGRPQMRLDVVYDGQIAKTVTITPATLFTFDNRFVLDGAAVTSGRHTLTLVKSGTGPLYFNAFLDYFTREGFVTAAGLEIRVQRKLYRLAPETKRIPEAGADGQAAGRRVEAYRREEILHQQPIASGELVEVELTIESKNDYEYLVFEDMKAAGLEPLEVRSGYNGNALGAYVEFRDETVCFFVQHLARGRHSVSYRLRAETPGRFSALPTKVYAMYAPELRANSDEIRISVTD
jgi:uncharacterized protein YfaS (alpha-2-macroglobulin family)